MIEKHERPRVADPEINKLEHEWWENNAALVARFWEMETSISDILRQSYLHEIKNFFLKGRSEVTVLELGCGSGWVGQSIAGNNIRIIGTDFSESQLALARANSTRRGLDKVTSYRVSTSAEWPAETRECNAVLIHSFLHHLDQNEIDQFLNNLRDKVVPGTRISIFEPAFYEEEPSDARPRWSSAYVLRLAERLVAKVNSDLAASTEFDADARDRFMKLFEEADAKGWYLSPKEVPFGLERFSRELGKRFDIVGSHWAIIFLIGWVFNRNLVTSPLTSEHWLWNLIVRLDRLLARDTSFLHARLRKPGHAFHVWHCIRS